MKNRYVRSALIALISTGALAVGGPAQAELPAGQPTINLTPEQQKKLLPNPVGVQLKNVAAKLPPIASLSSATLSIANSPFDAWCENNAGGTASGRVFVQTRFPHPDSLRTPYGTLVVTTGAGESRTRILLGDGRSNATGPISFPAREVCTDRCVSVRLEPEGTPTGYTVNTASRSACLP